MIKIALPNKGALFDPTMDLLSSSGYKVSKTLKSLSVLDEVNGIEFFFLRPGDIPMYVVNGILDAGITGKDFIYEKEPLLFQKTNGPIFKFIDLDYGYSKFCLAMPNPENYQSIFSQKLKGVRIATAFPGITKNKFPEASIIELEGAVEISVKLGIADVVTDIVETGTTLKQAGLSIVGNPLYESNAIFFVHPGKENLREIAIFGGRLLGKLYARSNMMVEYDVPADKLAEACRLTPGVASPTITPLREKDWFSVKSVVKKKEVNAIMDSLLALGCKGIILTTIENARVENR
jgi:ATP phosphoribosyltransferase